MVAGKLTTLFLHETNLKHIAAVAQPHDSVAGAVACAHHPNSDLYTLVVSYLACFEPVLPIDKAHSALQCAREMVMRRTIASACQGTILRHLARAHSDRKMASHSPFNS